jgi:metallo-beta-lactamase class B
MRKLLSLFAVLCLGSSLWPAPLAAQKDPTSRSWNQPVEPFRIAGNLYYVGASDITSFLITTPQGHILLDGGFEETVPLIRESVKKLGFKMKDVKILLNNHSHYDHAGGLAALKKLTGAKLVASVGDAPLLARGGKDDYLFGDEMSYPPVKADRIVRDGDTVTLGGTTLTAHVTAGHTPGCTTWTMTVEDGGERYDVVFAGSTSVLPKAALTGNAKYPTIATDYAHTFEVLKKLPCDIFLSSHGSFFDLEGKAGRLRKGETPNPFVDRQGYRDWVERNEAAFRKALFPAAPR